MNKLKEYIEKRNFTQTSEPKGEEKISENQQRQFVIQKHDASNLHYDFRLQIGGVLVSWAVPKGISTDPSDKRLAIRTEDHPISYGNFEGVIPQGNYGAGTVMIWDKGTFENIRSEKEEDGKSLSESLEEGKIEVRLNGEKVRGGYVLIRTSRDDNEKWLLKKIEDEEADARRKPVRSAPKSVVSGRSLKEIENQAKA